MFVHYHFVLIGIVHGKWVSMNNLKSEKTDLFFRDLCFLSQMIYDNDFIVTRNEQETKA